MTTPILTVTAQAGSPGVTVLHAQGEIDHDSRTTLKRVAEDSLRDSPDKCLVIDLSAITFCDSGGLSLFVELHRETTAQGGWLRLSGATGMVRGVLQATNLDRMFTLYDDARTASA